MIIKDKRLIKVVNKSKKVVVPNGIEEIHSRALSNCDMEECYLPKGLKYIGYEAFGDNDKLLKLEIPSSVEHIRGDIIDGCDNLVDIIVYDNISTISKNTFIIKHKYLGKGKYINVVPSNVIIRYSSYGELDKLLNKLIVRGCFNKSSSYKLKLVGSGLSKKEKLMLCRKIIRLNYYDFIFIDNEDMDREFSFNIRKLVRKK